MSEGHLITIEGVHGAGKTAVIRRLIESLQAQDTSVTYSQDQAGTELGRGIRRLHLEQAEHVDIFTETFLVAAARREAVATVVHPQLAAGQTVISERFADAFFAFGFARSIPRELLDVVGRWACDGLEPEVTVLLDLPPELAVSRLATRPKHRVEREPLEFHARLREGYLVRAREFPERIKIVDASLSPERVFERVWAVIAPRLSVAKPT